MGEVRAEPGALITFVRVEASDFRWLAGEEALVRYRATPDSVYQRSFCPRCGSTGPIPVAERVYMPAGCLDGDPGVRPNRHIFTGRQHNPPWFPITDDLEQYEAFGGGSPSLPEGSIGGPRDQRHRALVRGHLRQGRG